MSTTPLAGQPQADPWASRCPTCDHEVPDDNDIKCVDCWHDQHAAEVADLRAQLAAKDEAARDLVRRDADFQEWAQCYLDSGRWAGHDRGDAIKTELLERDALIQQLTEALREIVEDMRIVAMVAGQVSVEGPIDDVARMAEAQATRATAWADRLTAALPRQEGES